MANTQWVIKIMLDFPLRIIIIGKYIRRKHEGLNFSKLTTVQVGGAVNSHQWWGDDMW